METRDKIYYVMGIAGLAGIGYILYRIEKIGKKFNQLTNVVEQYITNNNKNAKESGLEEEAKSL